MGQGAGATVSLHYFNIIGPRQDPKSQYAAVGPSFIAALASGKQPTTLGGVGQIKTLPASNKVVEANILVATVDGSKVGGKVFNIGCVDCNSLNSLFKFIVEAFGGKLPPRYADLQEGAVQDPWADIALAQKCFGYKPSLCLREGLYRTVAWLRNCMVGA